VVTHNVPDAWSRDDAPFTFVTYGVESAVAQAAAVAGDGIVGVGAADIVQQCVKASPLDEIVINLAVLRGDGIRTAARWSTAARDTDRSLLFGLRRVAHRRCGAANFSYGQDNTGRAYLRSSR
jgi:dihydrofolate reductase